MGCAMTTVVKAISRVCSSLAPAHAACTACQAASIWPQCSWPATASAAARQPQGLFQSPHCAGTLSFLSLTVDKSLSAAVRCTIVAQQEAFARDACLMQGFEGWMCIGGCCILGLQYGACPSDWGKCLGTTVGSPCSSPHQQEGCGSGRSLWLARTDSCPTSAV